LVTLVTVWRVPEIARYRWDANERMARDMAEEKQTAT
jgi:hypothetical protein